MEAKVLAGLNFASLEFNAYPGRGIVAGLNESGTHLVQIYWIMGRSENSRNRVFKAGCESGRLYTEFADSAKVENPNLIFYNAMLERGRHFIVSNGDQTDTVAKTPEWLRLNQALAARTYEPDAPHFTQRITAMSSTNDGRPFIQMSILRKSPYGDQCDRFWYEYEPYPSLGYCITTYAKDGDPLPPYCGDPQLMPIMGDLQGVAESYWAKLNEANRVALAVKFIDLSTGRSDIHIINQYDQMDG